MRLTARAQLRARRQEREGVARQPPVVPGQVILIVRLALLRKSVGIHRVFRRIRGPLLGRILLRRIPDANTGAHDVREVGQRGDGVLGEPSPRTRRVVIRNRHPRIVAIRRHPLVPLLPQTHRPYGAAQGTQRLARLRINDALTAE